MGLLQDGKWGDQWYDTKASKGRFMRTDAQFRNWITADGAAGITGKAGFKAEPDRYHLYISHACPWAHRAMIFRALKGLEDMITVSVVDWFMGAEGWTLPLGQDQVNGALRLHQIYTASDAHYSGRVTVPILWDKQQGEIVSNESSEIIRMLNSAFDGVGARVGNYYPVALQSKIDDINARVYETLNNGVYRCGFATTQEAYEEALMPLFDTLDWLEGILSGQKYIAGPEITEADWRIFTTLVRFDPVYVGHFKCNLKRIIDYPNLSNYLRDLYQVRGVVDTVHMDHIKNHYYGSHETVNPSRIVPMGPEINYLSPHDRGRFNQNI